jgi:uncharacterized protein DUF2752
VGLTSSTGVATAGERLRAAAFVVAAMSVLGLLYLLFNPSTSSTFPTCPFLALTGCSCPGCGSLRALHQLTRGHLLITLGLNPFMVLSLPFIGYFFVSCAMLAFVGRPLRTFFVRPVVIWALLGTILFYWVLRNIPVYPFSLLAP